MGEAGNDVVDFRLEGPFSLGRRLGEFGIGNGGFGGNLLLLCEGKANENGFCLAVSQFFRTFAE